MSELDDMSDAKKKELSEGLGDLAGALKEPRRRAGSRKYSRRPRGAAG